ncbi:hypothetical protein DL98DRAFT_104178 [Cadophora sp. DSE1049]|nr:hypothetical protein DL98DRAFT_104178 [Cadophora sp. DSE1049]
MNTTGCLILVNKRYIEHNNCARISRGGGGVETLNVASSNLFKSLLERSFTVGVAFVVQCPAVTAFSPFRLRRTRFLGRCWLTSADLLVLSRRRSQQHGGSASNSAGIGCGASSAGVMKYRGFRYSSRGSSTCTSVSFNWASIVCPWFLLAFPVFTNLSNHNYRTFLE